MGFRTDTISLAVSCSSCGGAHIATRDTAREDSPTWCRDCGSDLGEWGEVKDQARAAVFDAMRDDFRVLLRSDALLDTRMPAAA